MILRLILGLAVLLFAAWLIRRLVMPGKTNGEQKSFEKMVTCERCGLYLPRRDAHEQGGQYYCCAEHAEPDA